MTIHHDKLAYGKLASSREDVSEKRLAEMLEKLNEKEKKDDTDAKPEKDGESK